MRREAIWTTRAEADLLREFTRSEEALTDSGTQLLLAVEAAVNLLQLNPRMAPSYSGRYRRLVLRNRRFGIIYIVEPRGIIIHAICDLRQDRDSILNHLAH